MKPIIMVCLMLAVTILKAVGAQDEEEITWRGYLTDARYAADVASWESLGQKAKKYPRERGLAKEAREGGYGVVSRGVFYAFDAKGNELALELLKKSEKSAGIIVEVSGRLPKSGGGVAVAPSEQRKWEPGRDRLGRPTYDRAPAEPAEKSYGGSLSLGRRGGKEAKVAVESLKEVESLAVRP